MQLGIPLRGRERTKPRRDADRPGADRAAPIRVARGEPRRLVRIPPLAVLGYRASRRRLRGGAASRTRGRGAGACRGGGARGCAALPLPRSLELRAASEPGSHGARRSCGAMMRNAWGLEAPPITDDARPMPAAVRVAERVLGELEMLDRGGVEVTPRRIVRRARAHAVPPESPAQPGASRSSTTSVPARGRSTSCSCSGSRRERSRARTRPSPLLSDELRRRARAAASSGRIGRARSLPLLHDLHARDAAARTRPRGCRRRGRAARAEPVLGRRPTSLFDEGDVGAPTRRRPLSRSDLAARVGAERARAAARARPARGRGRPDGAAALAAANDWSRRLDRARSGVRPRRPRLRNGAALDRSRAKYGRSRRPSSSGSPTARRRGSSSASSTRRRIDAEPDPMLRGQVLHTTLNRFYARLPRELDSERVTPENARRGDRASSTAVSTTRSSPGVRLDLTELQAAELEYTLRSRPRGLRLRDEAASEVGVRSAAARGRVRLGPRGSGAPARSSAR